MVLGNHLSFELDQSVFGLLGIQFHDALHSHVCRASHLVNGSPAQACRRVCGQRAHRCRSTSAAIFTVATTLAILAPTILSARIFAATKLPVVMFTPVKFTTILAVTEFPTGIFAALKFTTVFAATKLWTVLATTILTTWATIALMVWASGGA